MKRIKTAFRSAGLTDTAKLIANIIGRKPPAQQPVLWGLIDKTTSKKAAAMEQQIQLLEYKLKASNIKAKKVNSDGMTLKSILNSEEGHPHCQEVKGPQELQQQNKDSKDIIQILAPTIMAQDVAKERRTERDERYHVMGRRPPGAVTWPNLNRFNSTKGDNDKIWVHP